MPEPAPFALPTTPLAHSAAVLVKALRAKGHDAFWVGGCVRDLLLGRDPEDYDIATSARPEEIERIFSRTVPVGRKFGVLLVVEGGRGFQVATFRSETGYQDGRHPEHVTFTDARQDAQRRDFTVNGLFYDPEQGQLWDWVDGIADLRRRVIRTIGDPEVRYAEDHLRLLRTVRFAAQLDFTIAGETLEALRRNVARIAAASAERIREELLKVFLPPYAARGLTLLRDSGLLAHVVPELAATAGCDQSPEFHPEGTVFEHIRQMLERIPLGVPTELIWSALLHDIAKPVTATRDPATGTIHFYGHESVGARMAGEILQRLRFPRRELDAIVTMVRHHMQFKDALRMRPSSLRRMFLRPSFALELELHRLDCLASHANLEAHRFLAEEFERFCKRPELRPGLLRGRDLLELGMRPGPAVGILLKELRELQLQDTLRTPEEARVWAAGVLARRDLGAPEEPRPPSSA